MIYICIPTHNEQQTVGVVLWKLRQVLTDFPRDYQLLVADDASTDKTPEVLEPYTRVLPLTLIRSEKRHGWAASLEMLLREAVRRSEYPKRDAIVTLQADFSEEPDDIVPLIKRIEAGADVAVGNKVSATKEPRSRRFARSLASFFMRRQKWPEGVVTPFEGYRAYRLHAVKRALEDRNGTRLIRHDGWAGHAELLKSVLPHARRVDVVDVDDRPDRLQRPRREKPFAAAMQVRVMAAGTEPQGLTGVEELDRIATTASRSRERAAVTAQSLQAGRSGAARANGTRSRQGSGARREEGRTRGQARAQAGGQPGGQAGGQTNGRTRTAQTGTAKPRRERAQSSEGRTRQKEEGRPSGRTAQAKGQAEGDAKAEGRRRQPRTETAAAAAAAAIAPEELVKPLEGVEAGAEAAPRPKRKRRRRKRGGAGGAANAAARQDGAAEPSAAEATEAGAIAGVVSEPGGGEPAAGGESGGEPGAESAGAAATGEKKRRRRGGRRGGRGRRKPRPEGAAGEGDGSAGEGDAPAGEGSGSTFGEGGAAPAPSQPESREAAPARSAEPAARTETD